MSMPSFPYQDQFTAIAQQGREAAIEAVRTWTEAVQRLASQPGASAPDVGAVIDNAFDLAERLLKTQRELTKSALHAAATSTANTADATVQTVGSAADQGAQAPTGAASAGAEAEAGHTVAHSTAAAADPKDSAAAPTKATRRKPTPRKPIQK